MATFGGFGGAAGGGFGAAPASPSPFGGGAAGGGAFGAPSTPAFGGGKTAFGAPASGFGGGGFGAAQPQQQATTGFGGFGAAPAASTGAATGFGAASATAGGFGGFGAAPAAPTGAGTGFGGGGFGASAASSPFGTPKPAASPFGSSSVFGGAATGAAASTGFGAPAASSGFGSPAPAFGAATGGFGAPKTPFGAATTTTSAFGQPAATGATGGFGGFGGAQPAAGMAPGAVQVGTGSPPYQPTREVEPSGVGTANYVSISRMPAYSHKSTEELRYEDYLKRTNPAAAQAAATQNAPAAATAGATGAGAFGGASAFGAQQSAPSAFSTSTFGSAPSGFGASAPASTGFGTTSTFGGATTGGFGTSTGFGASTGGGLFGKTTTATGGFGASAPAVTAFSAPTINTTSGFGAPAGGFGAAPTASSGFGAGGFGSTGTTGTSGFGGFGSTATAAAPTTGFGGSSFGKTATTGFGGFGATATAAPATGGFNFGGGATAQQPAGSAFGAATNTATSAPFSFGTGAPKPAASTGFNFGGTTGGAFGSAPAAGGGFGATTGTGAFGAPASQPLGGTSTSLFGSTTTGAAGGGGFNFGGTSAAPTTSTGMFGSAPKPGGLFGGSTLGSAPTTGGTSLFGGSTGSSLFGGATAAPAAGTSAFGTGSFGAGATNSFGGFGAAAGGASPTTSSFGGFGTSLSGGAFGQTGQQQQQPQAAVAQPTNLVAAPDVNPYGAGSYGAGLVEQNVKAALELQSIKSSGASASASRLTHDVGLPRRAMDVPLITRRQSVTSRHTIPMSFVRGSFKGSKGRFASFASSALTASARFGGGDSYSSGQDDEFKFSSSLFRNSSAKKLIINKGDQPPKTSARASVIPTDDDRQESARARQLKPDEDGKYAVSFRNLTNRKAFTVRLYPNQTIKQARSEVKQLLRASSTGAAKASIKDIELVWKGRIVEDSVVLEDLRMKEGESVDIVVIEDSAPAEEPKKAEAKKKAEAPVTLPVGKTDDAPPKRFMTYDEFLASAIRDSTDDEPVEASASGPSSAACPVLKNTDYYTVPSYERLQQMTESELAQVEGFTVGCHGLGSVEWIGKTDVRYLNLDELIFFERKEVIVYKDEEHNKHPLGSGLNKPAIVELLGIFPPRKSPTIEAYKERVKQRTQDIGATFLDYSGDKGIWRFRVEHFSRYGFDDDDDDDVDMADAATQQPLQDVKNKMAGVGRELLANRPSSAVVTADRAALFRNSSMFSASSSSAVASFGGETFVPSGSRERWVTGSETASLSAEADAVALENPASPRAEPEKVSMPTSLCFPMPPISLKPLGLGAASDHVAPSDKSPTYQLMQQAAGQPVSAARNHMDAGVFMARSFRCSWGPNGEFVNLGRLVTKPQSADSFDARTRHRVCIEFPLRSAATIKRKAAIHDGLKMHFECASQRQRSVSEDEEHESDKRVVPNAPHVFALPSDALLVRCLHRYVEFAETLANKSGSGFAQQKHQLWKLVRALWGQEHTVKDMESNALLPLAARDDPTALENLDTFQWLDLRRQFLSRWLEDAVRESTPGGFLSTSPESVLQLLMQHRIADAAETAMGCGDFRLATLVAQADSMESADFRSLLETQMASWSDNGTLEFMDESIILIYSLLSGSVEVVTTNLFQQGKLSSWLVGLAQFFWYKQGPATSLETVLKWLREAIEKRQTPAPRSPFVAAGDKDDVLMEVMKLYVDATGSLCDVLSPSGWAASQTESASGHHLDYELSWHLHSVLRAIGYRLDSQWESHIQQNFICQLEGAGLWEDALYVALTISDAAERASTCRALLMRNADMLHKLPAAQREELAVRLGLPMEWVSEALAVLAVSKRARHEEIAHWMAAQQFEAAHACLVAHVAAPCLFAGEKDVLYQLLSELEPHRLSIPQWSSCARVDAIGGGLVLEYLRLEQQKGLEAGRELEFLQRVQNLSQLLASAKSVQTEAADKRVKQVAQTCVSSMMVALATQAVQLQTLLSFTHEHEMTASEHEAREQSPASTPPLELQPEFLRGLARLTSGRESSFVETYRTSQLLHVCSAFLDWRA